MIASAAALVLLNVLLNVSLKRTASTLSTLTNVLNAARALAYVPLTLPSPKNNSGTDMNGMML